MRKPRIYEQYAAGYAYYEARCYYTIYKRVYHVYIYYTEIIGIIKEV